MANPKKPTSDLEMISFRVTKELYARLEKIAKTEFDDSGAPLTAATAARRLMNRALDEAELHLGQKSIGQSIQVNHRKMLKTK